MFKAAPDPADPHSGLALTRTKHSAQDTSIDYLGIAPQSGK